MDLKSEYERGHAEIGGSAENRYRPIPVGRDRPGCHNCAFKPRCLPADLEGHSLKLFERSICRLPRAIKPGEKLAGRGSTAQALYTVRVGCLKVVMESHDGSERVVGFHLPGTVIGLTEIDYQTWSGSFVALQDTWLCRIPLESIDSSVRRQMVQLMSARLRTGYLHHCTLASKTNPARLAAFLLDISEHFRERNLAPDRFHLPMQYKDIANYLGMRHESVSRALHDFQQRGLLERDGNHIRLPDIEGLRQYCLQ